MKITRVSASVLTLAALSLLAACGGGGGGGGVTPPGGGNTGGGSTPTPVSTSTPTVAPTATPGVGVSSQVISAEEDWINGSTSWYTSGTAGWANSAGDPSNAPQGSAVDSMSCQSVTEGANYPQNAFSQHVFVGILYNGTEEALPQALGMVKPVAPTQGTPSHPTDTWEVENNQCEYNIHTHDYSGLVHVEDESVAQSNSGMPSYASLQSFLDVSGFQLSATGLTAGASTLSGPVTIYTGTPAGRNGQGNDQVSMYAPFAGAASSLMFTKHEAIWIVIGTPPAAGLPQVQFVLTN